MAEDALATPDRSPILLTAKALAEIAKASAGVNMRTMPQIPDDAPCRFPGSDPNDWFDPLHNLDMIGVAPRFLDEIAASLCEDCPVLGQCLTWALANPKQEGILGGLTHKRRINLLRNPVQRRRPRRLTA